MLLKRMDSRPQRPEIADARQKQLLERVKRALSSIPSAFRSPINIEGIDATDLFSMNTLLGSAIEVQTVEALKGLRSVWDPDNEWVGYDFVRFPQSFPDVRLIRTEDDTPSPALGIELKSWYLLSKEAEPSFRHRVTSAACANHDLFVIVPWSLSNVLSGTPVVYSPFVEQAKYISEMRNYYWVNTRVKGNPKETDAIKIPDDIHPYPPANTPITDLPVHDGGGNFGRIGRVHEVLGDWTQRSLLADLAGIPAIDWIAFLKQHTESSKLTAGAALDNGFITRGEIQGVIDGLVQLSEIAFPGASPS